MAGWEYLADPFRLYRPNCAENGKMPIISGYKTDFGLDFSIDEVTLYPLYMQGI